MGLISRWFEVANIKHEDLKYAGKHLRCRDNGKLVFEGENDQSIFMDFLFFERNRYGKTMFNSLYESDMELNELEE